MFVEESLKKMETTVYTMMDQNVDEQDGLVRSVFGPDYSSDDDTWFPETPEEYADAQNAYVFLHDLFLRSKEFYHNADGYAVGGASLYEDQETGHVHILYADTEPHYHLWAFPSKAAAMEDVNARVAVLPHPESPLEDMCSNDEENLCRGYCLSPFEVSDWGRFLDAVEAKLGHSVRAQSDTALRQAVWDRLDRCPEWAGKGRGEVFGNTKD